MKTLRRQLRDDADNATYIFNEPGVGLIKPALSPHNA